MEKLSNHPVHITNENHELDQLCYTVDPNRFRKTFDEKEQLSLTLAIDYNKDRIFHLPSGRKEDKEEAKSFATPFQDSSESITIETIGKNKK